MRLIEIGVVLLFLLIYTIYLPRLVIKQDIKSIKLIILEITLQNIVCMMASDAFNYSIAQLIILYKEIVMYGAVFVFFFLKKKMTIKKYLFPIIVMIFICVPYFFIGSASLFTKLICFRQIMTPLILILYGSTYRFSEQQIKDVLKYIVNLGIFQCFFGLIERFVLGDGLWRSLNITKYMAAKGFSAYIFNNGMPGNYYSADLYNYVGMLRRLVGFLTDPLLTGHYLAFCIIVLLFTRVYENDLKEKCAIILCTVTLLLTLSKGALLIIAIGFIYKLWQNNKIAAYFLGMVSVSAIVLMIQGNTLYTLTRHVEGLTTSLSTEYIVGKGLGSSGNYANLYGQGSETGGESFIGAIIGQMGIPGLATFIYAVSVLLKRIKYSDKTIISSMVYAYILAALIESTFSESAINYVGSGVAFIIFGMITDKTSDVKEKMCLE